MKSDLRRNVETLALELLWQEDPGYQHIITSNLLVHEHHRIVLTNRTVFTGTDILMVTERATAHLALIRSLTSRLIN